MTTEQQAVPSLDEWMDQPPDEFLVAVRDGAEGRFRVTTRKQLAWVMRKIAGIRAEAIEVRQLAQANIEQINAWLELKLSPLSSSEEFFVSLARGYLVDQIREQVPDWDGALVLDDDGWKLVRTKTFPTPRGDAAIRRSNGKFVAPAGSRFMAATVAVLDACGRGSDLVHQPRSVRATELNAAVQAGTARVVDGYYEVLSTVAQTCSHLHDTEAGEEWFCQHPVVTKHTFADPEIEAEYSCAEHDSDFDRFTDHTAEPYSVEQWVRLEHVRLDGAGELRFEMHTVTTAPVPDDDVRELPTREVAVEAGR